MEKRKSEKMLENPTTKRMKMEEDSAPLTPDFAMDEDGDGRIESGDNWERNPLPPNLNPSTFPLVLQQLEVDYTLTESVRGMPGLQCGRVPVIRMFGCTKEGYRFVMGEGREGEGGEKRFFFFFFFFFFF